MDRFRHKIRFGIVIMYMKHASKCASRLMGNSNSTTLADCEGCSDHYACCDQLDLERQPNVGTRRKNNIKDMYQCAKIGSSSAWSPGTGILCMCKHAVRHGVQSPLSSGRCKIFVGCPCQIFPCTVPDTRRHLLAILDRYQCKMRNEWIWVVIN